MDLKRICRTIENGIAAVKKEQSFGGGFSSLSSSSNPSSFDAAFHPIQYQTTFFAANILCCLNSVEPFAFDYVLATPECSLLGNLIAIQKFAAQFLTAEKSEHWSFNYWARDAAERKTMPYPDDLDDTFVALAALYGYNPKLLTGGALAHIAKLLAAVEVEQPGGSYRTWLVKTSADNAWCDVDIVVNSNVGYFLSRFGVTLPNLAKFFDERILAGDISSPYYPGVVQAIYFISRFYDGTLKGNLREILFSELDNDGLWRNPLESAMAISALINLGLGKKISERDIGRFMDQIDAKGYQPYVFCMDPSRDEKKYYAGSAALTAAFCAEALAKYVGISKPEPKENKNEDATIERIKLLACERTALLPENLRAVVLGEIEKITAEEIVGVPFLMHAALGFPENVPTAILDELALANLYGWIAYTIYDDFLDGEGNPLLLSAANYFLRELMATYASLDARIPGIGEVYSKCMNIIDDANVYEQLRRPVILEQLADRSLGHALPAIAVLSLAGYPPDSREAEAMQAFFRNYLIARQMHDDAHDWKEDLLRGQINSAAARLLAAWKKENPRDDFAKHIPELQKLFWHEIIPEIVVDIKKFLNKARQEIANINVIKNPAAFETLIGRFEASADRTIRERDQAVDFIKTYQTT